MIDLEAARKLLDFGRRIGEGSRAEEQLRGAVAIHNILRKHGVAYLADEVGMGKTYVALGALALFRHYDPSFRVLIIAPRENIQRKWQKELRNFVAHNMRFADMRMASLDEQPARPLVSCGNLTDLARETSLDPNRDFFVRMSSFSLALGKTTDDWERTRDALRKQLPGMSKEAFSLRSKDQFKKNFARALCCALPTFDLVIVDEAHNLKHGFHPGASSRNHVIAEMFGRHAEDDVPDRRLFRDYGKRAKRVLFLSATPLEESYGHIWNQLDLFGLAAGFDELKNEEVPESRKKELASRFLVRRVTTIRVADREHTKNMYRREWRAGGVADHDQPIQITDPRQRLVVALVQKKVSELLSGKRFNRSFQIGMLASFESFLETAKLKRGTDELGVFDDSEQTEIVAERDGLDVHDLNRLARDYRKTFGREMPHPKMDAIVHKLSTAWLTGEKSLVFVRRVASVKELKRKLDDLYDDWLIPRVRAGLPEELRAAFAGVEASYRREKEEADTARQQVLQPVDMTETTIDVDDRGGHDSFFAWFFRGDGPKGVVSGANVQGRFSQASGAYATFFSDNHVMALLGAAPGSVLASLAQVLSIAAEDAASLVRARAAKYLTTAKTVTRTARLEAAQAAALELLSERSEGALAERATIIWEERYQASAKHDCAKLAPPEIASALEHATFFNELRRPERQHLRAEIWPEPKVADGRVTDFRQQFREQELRAQLLGTAARLGHAFIDLYVLAMRGRTTLAGRAREDAATDTSGDTREDGASLLHDYAGLLDQQRATGSGWGAFVELSLLANNFDLILDVNAPNARTAPLQESERYFTNLLRQQQPVAGMSGQVNQTLVRQFRMPGYPFVLISTDLLQEGEDLHTFCSSVYHYGISWTPSSMEQRIGRIDRVRSQTDRRLSLLKRELTGDDLLQVHFPFLGDTIEVLQVERVLRRMDTFLRLMHEGIAPPAREGQRIDIRRELVGMRTHADVVREPLKSAFPLPEWALHGNKRELAVDAALGAGLRVRLESLALAQLGDLPIQWALRPPKGTLMGTATLPNGRKQPVILVLGSHSGVPVIRCISPIGRTDPELDPSAIEALAAKGQSRVGAILTRVDRSYDLTVEDDVLLGAAKHDAVRVGLLLRRVVTQADAMEHEHFEDGRDAPLETFDSELREENIHGH